MLMPSEPSRSQVGSASQRTKTQAGPHRKADQALPQWHRMLKTSVSLIPIGSEITIEMQER